MDFQQKPLFDSSSKSVSETSTGFCECNICLDSAQDPVVTLCGHLYCWACIYKWLHIQTDNKPNCPVCKSHISSSSLIPLYGRGNSPPSNGPEPELKRAHQSELVIPNRPSAPGGSVLHMNQQIHPVPFQAQPQPNPFGSYAFGPANIVGPEPELKRAHQSELVIPNRPSAPGGSVLHMNQQIHPVPFQAQPQPNPFGSYAFGPANIVGPVSPTGFSNAIVGMVGEMVCGMIFRSSDPGFLGGYPYGSYHNSYQVSGDNPRVRRQVMQVEKSLNRLTIFLFCCFMLCLLLF